jgi:hypothetical protein
MSKIRRDALAMDKESTLDPVSYLDLPSEIREYLSMSGCTRQPLNRRLAFCSVINSFCAIINHNILLNKSTVNIRSYSEM